MKLNHVLLTAAALLIVPAVSQAASETYQQDINVTATVPNPKGLSVSDPTGWTQHATMSYNATTSNLNPIAGSLHLKSPKTIKAHLTHSPALTSAAAGTSIPLKVLVDNVELGSDPNTAVMIVQAGQAKNVKPVTVKIERTEATALVPGTYTGMVGIMFEGDM